MKLFGAPYPVLKRVIVNTKTGHSYRGVLWMRRGGFLVLRNAETLQENAILKIDGEAIIPEENVEFIQGLEV